MKKFFLIFIFFALNSSGIYSQGKLLPPDFGMYAGAFPDMGNTEDSVTLYRINLYVNLTGHKPSIICFSNNWFNGIKFPEKAATTISWFMAVPYIRIMPRSNWQTGRKDPKYDLEKILDGDFDDELAQWARDAKKFGKPLLVEFAPEMNGNWFPWSGVFNGKKEGAELYRDAHRHIVKLMRDEGADNLTWMFHVNGYSNPQKEWNTMKAYYPGDKYIDWLGISVYGSQKPGDEYTDFKEIFQKAYWELEKVSSKKPIALAEFGVIEDSSKGDKAWWLRQAFETILSGYYPRLKAISYWHSVFENKDKSISNMRLDSNPLVLSVYKEYISKEIFRQMLKISK